MFAEAQPSVAMPKAVDWDPDDPASIFRLLEAGHRQGLSRALLTITGREGSGRREIGTQMAVLEDGRYCGYLSGGCIESIAATEAMLAIEHRRGIMLHFGQGSPFVDVVLPCGGAMHLCVTVDPDPAIVDLCLSLLVRREPFSMAIGPDGLAVLPTDTGGDAAFIRRYRPVTQVLVIGEGPEQATLVGMCRAAGFPVSAQHMRGSTVISESIIDQFTAIVVLAHDRGNEADLLKTLLASPAFYLGVLGSRRTHAKRLGRLACMGASTEQLRRLRGPIGAFGPARDSATLAISILSEIVQARAQLED